MAAGRTFEYSQEKYDDWIVVTKQRSRYQEPPTNERWFKGRLSRTVAEDYLSKSLKLDGTFLVRESDALSLRTDPVYVISVLYGGTVHHMEIETLENGKFTLAFVRGSKMKSYETLDKLVKHYQKKSIDLEGGGSTKLKYILEG